MGRLRRAERNYNINQGIIMCFGGSPPPPPPPKPPPPPPPPPAETAAVVKPAAKRRGGQRKSRRGTSQLTVKRPTMGGSYVGSGVNLPT